MSATKNTREYWLLQAVERLRPPFDAAKLTFPLSIRVSCGWPSKGGLSNKKRVIGQCWAEHATSDKVTQIFVSPVISEPVQALAVLVHELIHAALPEAKHGAAFKSAMRAIGLEGKATATTPSAELTTYLTYLATELGTYDNGQIEPNARASDTPKTQKNRQLKVACDNVSAHEDGEPYILRGAKKTLERGIPDCPLCGQELILEVPNETEDEPE